MAGLISALHALAQAQMPVVLVAAGLPQVLGQMGRAKDYADSLFEYVELAALSPSAAWEAIVLPIEQMGQEIEPDAVRVIMEETQGYPHFLQLWGKFAWDLAFCSPISVQDAENATIIALADLDTGFFSVGLNRLTPSEKRYMRAMAELGPGPHRSSDISDILGKRVTQLAPIRHSLIMKGMIYSPAHGDTAFTVPKFDAFLLRAMPE